MWRGRGESLTRCLGREVTEGGRALNSIVSSGIESMSECKGRLRVKMSESVIPGVAACLGPPQRGSGTEIAVTRAMGTPGLKPSG